VSPGPKQIGPTMRKRPLRASCAGLMN